MSRFSDSFFDIRTTLKGKPSGLPFLRMKEMKEKVIGSKYELSLVFVGKKRIRTLNRIYRNKDSATDVLSFPNTTSSGEIFICPEKAYSKAKLFKRPPRQHLAFLYIHGLLHLKGLDHGPNMEKEEKRFSAQFGIEISE